MTFQQLSARLRQVRSAMPRRTSEEAYAQMQRLMENPVPTTISTDPKKNGLSSSSGPRRTD